VSPSPEPDSSGTPSTGVANSGRPAYDAVAYREMPDSINVTPRNPAVEFLKYITLSVLLVLGIFWGATSGIDHLVPYLPKAADGWLAWVGDEYIKTLRKKNEVVESPSYNAMLEEMRPKLRDALGSDASTSVITVHQGKGDVMNAYALPGGHVVLYQALMDALPSKEAQRFVLAHELGHVMHRHSLQAAGRLMVVGSLALPVGVLFPHGGSQLIEVMNISAMQHSQMKELEADRYAVELLKATGHDPKIGIEVFEMFEKVASQDNVPDFVKTHPPNQRRIDQVKALTGL
jgi:beta-barrel assembly-enhancing protease